MDWFWNLEWYEQLIIITFFIAIIAIALGLFVKNKPEAVVKTTSYLFNKS